MPLYEYQCGKCNHRFEKIQKYSDPAPDGCPVCGGSPVTRLPSSPAIQFKGTGWYITDYAKKSGTDAGKAGSGEKGGSDKSDGGKSDGGKSDTAGKSDSGSTASSDASTTSSPAAAKDSKPG